MSVLVYVEHAEGKFKKSTFEVVSYAKAIAQQLNTNLVALAIGNLSAEQLSNLGTYGAQKVLHVNYVQLGTFNAQAYTSILSDAAQKEGATVVVLANSFSGKGLAPRLAVRLKAGLASGVVALPTLQGAALSVKRTAYSGKAFAHVKLSGSINVLALNANAFPVSEQQVSAEVISLASSAKPTDFKTSVKEIVRASDKISLPEADLVVSAGRGMKGPENWHLIEELAESLGAATACSKPVSDAGWRPHEEHVGQTGISVSPNLYIAVGISGAIQHLAGVSSSKTILVINKDPEAPFFKVADYGIVGDAMEVVPQLTAAMKAYSQNG